MSRLNVQLVRFFGSWLVGFPASVVLLSLSGLLMFQQSRLAGVPDIGDPFDVDAWGHIDVDPAENAAPDYETAVRLYRGVSEPDYDELEIVWKYGWEEASPAVQTWLDDNRAALQAWRVGTEKNMHLRAQPAEMTIENSLNVGEVRNLLRLAALESERLRFRGDTPAAWEWHRASLRCTRHLGMNAFMIDRTTAAVLYNRYADRIVAWARDSNVTSHQLAQALADVRVAWSLSSSLSASVRVEYFLGCKEFGLLDEMRPSFDRLADAFGQDDLRIAPDQVLLLNNEPELTQRLLQHQIANLLEFADEPLFRQPAMLAGDIAWFDVQPPPNAEWLSPSEFQRALEKSLLGRIVLLGSDCFRFIHRERAHQGLMELLLAAEWYRRVAGEFPETTDELLTVPMLDEVPLDALSRTETPLRYERDPDNPRRAKVWSVGEDGIDDGGALEHVPSVGPPDLGFWIGEPEPQAPPAE